MFFSRSPIREVPGQDASDFEEILLSEIKGEQF